MRRLKRKAIAMVAVFFATVSLAYAGEGVEMIRIGASLPVIAFFAAINLGTITVAAIARNSAREGDRQ
jgi:hypothetical protein